MAGMGGMGVWKVGSPLEDGLLFLLGTPSQQKEWWDSISGFSGFGVPGNAGIPLGLSSKPSNQRVSGVEKNRSHRLQRDLPQSFGPGVGREGLL